VAPPRFAFLDHPGPIPFAHRGGAAEGPENTWASFSHARDLGYRYLETDVHATTDGVVAVIHDPSLDRVSDRTGTVGELSWAEVAAARIDGREPIPRLDELLGTWPELRWNIDAKHEAVVGPLV
jgi:glycerophosphoryl diester phosphodiesterase